jgi:hypothetical protein
MRTVLVVEAHGGRIALVNRSGGGPRVTSTRVQ